MKLRKSKIWLIVISAVVAIGGLAALGGAFWYRQMLQPKDASNNQAVRINIKEGMSSGDIATELENKQLIQNAFVFSTYIRLHGLGGKFKTGIYSVKASQSVAEMAAHLTSGKTDEVIITFYPGATLNTKAKNSDGREVQSVLKKAGYSDEEITEAFGAKYESSVFAGRPEGAGLEGYIYGETFHISPDESARQVLQRSISQFELVAKKYDLEAKFKAKGLTLYEGITLASIVQKESIACGAGSITCEDQRQIASVFFNRLKANMVLGSDVTYQYAADKTGVERTPNLESPYNTRINKGLPPGPIAVPGLSALNAVADPADTKYLYFLSGDDDITYFATTNSEHEANIKAHCQKKCQIS